MAIWAAGPPKASRPSLKNTFATSLNLTTFSIVVSLLKFAISYYEKRKRKAYNSQIQILQPAKGITTPSGNFANEAFRRRQRRQLSSGLLFASVRISFGITSRG
jgi:hypothetical protein